MKRAISVSFSLSPLIHSDQGRNIFQTRTVNTINFTADVWNDIHVDTSTMKSKGWWRDILMA